MNDYRSKNYSNTPVNKKEEVSNERIFVFLCIAIAIVLFSALPTYKILDKKYSEESGLGAAVSVIKNSISQNDDMAAFLGLKDTDESTVKENEKSADKSETNESDAVEYNYMSKEEIEAAALEYIREHTPKIVFPLDGIITSPFSPSRVNPFYDGSESELSDDDYESHTGIDISASKSTQIKAFADGVVKKVIYSNIGYGNHILISHYDRTETLYAHCSEMLVAVGDKVKAGDIIAIAGSTGRSTGVHLHFEIRINGEAVDPVAYMEKIGEDKYA